LRVEQRELLLDRDREVGPALERLARARELLVGGQPLLLSHRAEGYATGSSKRSATLAHDQRASTARRAAARSSRRRPAPSSSSSASLARRSSTSPLSNEARWRRPAGY